MITTNICFCLSSAPAHLVPGDLHGGVGVLDLTQAGGGLGGVQADREEHLLVLLHRGEHLARQIFALRLWLLLIRLPLSQRLLLLLLLLIDLLTVGATNRVRFLLLGISSSLQPFSLFQLLVNYIWLKTSYKMMVE